MTADGNHTYTYDAENRLIKVDGGNTAAYTYDALGHRVRKTTGSVWTDYLYDLSGNVLSEYDNICAPLCAAAGYVYLNGRLLAEYQNGTTYFPHKDHLGSTRLVTDYRGYYATECNDFYPFGERNTPSTPCYSTNAPNPSNITHKFTGDERDAETSLDHTQFRQYTSQARWITPDPAGLAAVDPTNPQSWNRYAYVLNNSMNSVDPSGLGGICLAYIWDGGCLNGPGGNGGLTCITDGVDIGCGQLFHQIFHDDKFAVLKAAYTSTGKQTIPDNSSSCVQYGDCGPGTTVDVYGNLGLLAFITAGPDSGDSGGSCGVPPFLPCKGATSGGQTMRPQSPPPPSTHKVTGGCMASTLLKNFFGNSGQTYATVGVHVAAYAAVKRLAPAVFPGPGWVYVGLAGLWDAAMVTKSYVDCRNNGGPSLE